LIMKLPPVSSAFGDNNFMIDEVGRRLAPGPAALAPSRWLLPERRRPGSLDPSEGEAMPGHPHHEITAALRECRAAGLHVEEGPPGPVWGRVGCPTGARALAVPATSAAPGLHARRLRIFLDEHRGHRPGERR